MNEIWIYHVHWYRVQRQCLCSLRYEMLWILKKKIRWYADRKWFLSFFIFSLRVLGPPTSLFFILFYRYKIETWAMSNVVIVFNKSTISKSSVGQRNTINRNEMHEREFYIFSTTIPYIISLIAIMTSVPSSSSVASFSDQFWWMCTRLCSQWYLQFTVSSTHTHTHTHKLKPLL